MVRVLLPPKEWAIPEQTRPSHRHKDERFSVYNVSLLPYIFLTLRLFWSLTRYPLSLWSYKVYNDTCT